MEKNGQWWPHNTAINPLNKQYALANM